MNDFHDWDADFDSRMAVLLARTLGVLVGALAVLVVVMAVNS